MNKKHRLPKKRNGVKSVLRLPDLEHAKAAVLHSLTSSDAQRGYRHAIDEFVEWYCSEPRLAFNRIVVLRYRSHLESRQLAPGTINLRLGAMRRLAYEAADCGLLSADLAAGIRRVNGVKKLGVRLGDATRCWRLHHRKFSGASRRDIAVIEGVKRLTHQPELKAISQPHGPRDAWIEGDRGWQIEGISSQTRHAIGSEVAIIIQVESHEPGVWLAGLRGYNRAHLPAS